MASDRDPAGASIGGQHRFHHLDGLRGIASINVVVSHVVVAFDFALYTGNPAESHGGWEIGVSKWPFLLPVAGANYSVCVFLVLSGYVLAHVYGRTGMFIPALALKRWLRLALPILAAVLFSYVILASGLFYNHAAATVTKSSWLLSQMVQSPSLTGAVVEALYKSLFAQIDFVHSYDTSLWTMPIEFSGSLALMVLFVIGRYFKIPQKRTLLAGVALFTIGLVCHSYYLSLMLYGAAIRMIDLNLLERSFWRPWLWGIFLVSLILGTVPYSSAANGWAWLIHLAPAGRDWWPEREALLPLDNVAFWHGVGAVLLLIAVDQLAELRRFFARPTLRFLGKISFPLYLVHVPILLSFGCGIFLAGCAMRWGYWPSAAIAATMFVAAALCVATLATYAVERPAIALSDIGGRMVQQMMGGLSRFSVERLRSRA